MGLDPVPEKTKSDPGVTKASNFGLIDWLFAKLCKLDSKKTQLWLNVVAVVWQCVRLAYIRDCRAWPKYTLAIIDKTGAQVTHNLLYTVLYNYTARVTGALWYFGVMMQVR